MNINKNNMFMDKDFITTIIENSYDGIFITDKTGLVLYVNQAY